MSERVLTVSDANVLIDIEVGGLTHSLFCLPDIDFVVPDVLFEAELRQNHGLLEEMGLSLCSLSESAVAKVFQMAAQHRRVSRHDLFALQLAREKAAMLLTGDRALRQLAQIYQIECHGMIWLVELMVKQEVIEVEQAFAAYDKMREKGSRIPWEEAKERLNAFSAVPAG